MSPPTQRIRRLNLRALIIVAAGLAGLVAIVYAARAFQATSSQGRHLVQARRLAGERPRCGRAASPIAGGHDLGIS